MAPCPIRAQTPDVRYPILISKASPISYISFKRALNLRLPGELTGDWHFEASFFGYPETFPGHQIDEWLWSEKDFDILIGDYLKPMHGQIRGGLRGAYDEWLPTVVFGADYD